MKAGNLLQGVFSTIRFGNLAILSLSLYLVRYTIVKPILQHTSESSSLSDMAYMLLAISTVLIAAGGYIINDYFDTRIDAINNPGKNKIGAVIPRKAAMVLYVFLNLTALIIGWYFGSLQGIRYPILVFILCAGLLYFYSTSYKKMFVTGNLVISFLAALSIWISILFDQTALVSEPIITLVGAYTVFAFIMTWIREIIKDCEDAQGDQAFGASTLPLVAGMNTARVLAAVLSAITFGSIIWIQYYSSQWQNVISFAYTTVFIQIPLILLLVRCLRAKSKKDDGLNSRLSKIIMLTGVLSMIVFQISSN